MTNLSQIEEVLKVYQARFGIEALFKDCKTGGYNFEKSHASNEHLKTLILLIALAYSCAILQGRRFKQMGIHKYIGRLIESRRAQCLYSSF